LSTLFSSPAALRHLHPFPTRRSSDLAQFSTAITELSPPAYVGTALTTQTCMGFALTMASIWLTPPLVRWAGWPWAFAALAIGPRSEEHTSELQSRSDLVCRLLLEKKN